MQTKIIKINNDWKHVKNVSRTTVNKEHTDNEATSAFKRKLLISEHSPIRLITVDWFWEGIKSWIATHYSRHKYECFISTQRDDRTDINRDDSPQGTLVNMDNSANAQHLIDVMRKRLCCQSHTEAREYAISLKKEIWFSGEEVLSDVLVCNCVYRNGCSEINNCGHFAKLVKANKNIVSCNIEKRYKAYNDIFWEWYN